MVFHHSVRETKPTSFCRHFLQTVTLRIHDSVISRDEIRRLRGPKTSLRALKVSNDSLARDPRLARKKKKKKKKNKKKEKNRKRERQKKEKKKR
ncbi:hypothetical protein PUN28_000604 [Cardiocondyla obscurior]|uniref:Uncharacterized protein n=1 Tax=Cardiocondyla obscurior TaxID=286306 RepID=A0AAW2H094_9HYME